MLNKDLLLIDHINDFSDKRSEEQMKKLKELSLKTEKIYKEMLSYRIAMKRIKKINKIWGSKL
jgi:hypothetical protein